jgi:LEA14-like dessication related protein
MNKSKWLFIAGLIGSIGVVEYRRYMSFLDTLSTSTRGLRIKKEGQWLNISFQLDVNNRSSKNVNIKSLRGTLYTGALKIGDFKINQAVTISANSKSTIPLTVLINANRLLNDISKYNPTAKITLKTKTVLNFQMIGLLGIPIGIKNITVFDGTSILNELRSFVSALKMLFKK